MATKHPKRPRDSNQLAQLIVDLASGPRPSRHRAAQDAAEKVTLQVGHSAHGALGDADNTAPLRARLIYVARLGARAIAALDSATRKPTERQVTASSKSYSSNHCHGEKGRWLSSHSTATSR